MIENNLCHILVWNKTSKINNNEYLNIYGGWYGDEITYPLSLLPEKLNYLWTAIWNYSKTKRELREWKEIIHFYCPNVNLYDVDETWCGIDYVENLYPLLTDMKKDIIILKNFLLSDESKIYIFNSIDYTQKEINKYYNTDLILNLRYNPQEITRMKDTEYFYYIKDSIAV